MSLHDCSSRRARRDWCTTKKLNVVPIQKNKRFCAFYGKLVVNDNFAKVRALTYLPFQSCTLNVYRLQFFLLHQFLSVVLYSARRRCFIFFKACRWLSPILSAHSRWKYPVSHGDPPNARKQFSLAQELCFSHWSYSTPINIRRWAHLVVSLPTFCASNVRWLPHCTALRCLFQSYSPILSGLFYWSFESMGCM